ncbi:MAG: hypothetical protein AAF212_04955, partial [Verrucomicrobiota bacterium]
MKKGARAEYLGSHVLRFLRVLHGVTACFIETIDRDISRFLSLSVESSVFSYGFFCRGRVNDIVYDLESQSICVSEFCRLIYFF